jgi:hypothetical protein
VTSNHIDLQKSGKKKRRIAQWWKRKDGVVEVEEAGLFMENEEMRWNA